MAAVENKTKRLDSMGKCQLTNKEAQISISKNTSQSSLTNKRNYKVDFCNQSEISSSVFSGISKQPKEIEDLFDGYRNFYQKSQEKLEQMRSNQSTNLFQQVEENQEKLKFKLPNDNKQTTTQEVLENHRKKMSQVQLPESQNIAQVRKEEQVSSKVQNPNFIYSQRELSQGINLNSVRKSTMSMINQQYKIQTSKQSNSGFNQDKNQKSKRRQSINSLQCLDLKDKKRLTNQTQNYSLMNTSKISQSNQQSNLNSRKTSIQIYSQRQYSTIERSNKQNMNPEINNKIKNNVNDTQVGNITILNPQIKQLSKPKVQMQIQQIEMHQGKKLDESSDNCEMIDSMEMSYIDDQPVKQNVVSTQDSQNIETNKSQETFEQQEKSRVNHYISIQFSDRNSKESKQISKLKKKQQLAQMQSQLVLGARKFSLEKQRKDKSYLKRLENNSKLNLVKNNFDTDSSNQIIQDESYSCSCSCDCKSQGSDQTSLCSCSCVQEQYEQECFSNKKQKQRNKSLENLKMKQREGISRKLDREKQSQTQKKQKKAKINQSQRTLNQYAYNQFGIQNELMSQSQPQMIPIDFINMQNYYAKIHQMNQYQQFLLQLPTFQPSLQSNYSQNNLYQQLNPGNFLQPLKPQLVNYQNISQTKQPQHYQFNNDKTQIQEQLQNNRFRNIHDKEISKTTIQNKKDITNLVENEKYHQLLQEFKNQSRNDFSALHSEDSTERKFQFNSSQKIKKDYLNDKSSCNKSHQKSQFLSEKKQQNKDFQSKIYQDNQNRRQDDEFQIIAKQSIQSIQGVKKEIQKISSKLDNQQQDNTQKLQPQKQPEQNDLDKQSNLIWIGFDESNQNEKQKNFKQVKHLSKKSQKLKSQSRPLENHNKKIDHIIQDNNIENENSNGQAWVMDFSLEPLNQQDQNQDTKIKQLQNRLQQKSLKRSNTQVQKKEYTKEEIANRKKEILKTARINVQQKNTQNQEKQESKKEEREKSDDVPTKLLSRLSQGLKPKINLKEMKKITSKNYEQLPEIQKRKKELIKKEDLLKRISNVKMLEQKRRQAIVQKRNAQKDKETKASQQNDEITV